MKTIINKYIPFKDFICINLFGILFVRYENRQHMSVEVVNHEKIHSAQARELLWVFFYLIYFFEWLWRSITANGYWDISFEKEALEHERDLDYLSTRKHFAQWRHKKTK